MTLLVSMPPFPNIVFSKIQRKDIKWLLKRENNLKQSQKEREAKQWSCDTTLMYTIFQHENIIIYCSYTYRSIYIYIYIYIVYKEDSP